MVEITPSGTSSIALAILQFALSVIGHRAKWSLTIRKKFVSFPIALYKIIYLAQEARQNNQTSFEVGVINIPTLTPEEFGKLFSMLIAMGTSIQYNSQGDKFIVVLPEQGSVEDYIG